MISEKALAKKNALEAGKRLIAAMPRGKKWTEQYRALTLYALAQIFEGGIGKAPGPLERYARDRCAAQNVQCSLVGKRRNELLASYIELSEYRDAYEGAKEGEA